MAKLLLTSWMRLPLEEFLKPMGISQYRLAKDISVPRRRINEIIQGKRAITADTALRLGRYFGTTAQSWLNLQMSYDLEVAEETLGDRLEREVRPRAQREVRLRCHAWQGWHGRQGVRLSLIVGVLGASGTALTSMRKSTGMRGR